MFLKKHMLPLAFLALVGCSGPHHPDAGRDAGIDAGQDAGRDGGVDSGPRDAGRDAGPDGGPDDPVWVPWAVLNEDCTIERATYPERVISPQWEPCVEQPVGCFRRVEGTGGAYAPAWHDGSRGYFTAGRADSRGRQIRTIAHTGGENVVAWREPSAAELLDRGKVCSLRIGVGRGYASATVVYFDEGNPDESLDSVYHASLTEIGYVEEPIAVLRPPTSAQGFYPSADLVGMWTGAYIDVVHADGRIEHSLNIGLPGLPQGVQVVGSHVFWLDWAVPVRIAHSSDGEPPPSYFHQADPADIKGFHTDGVEMAWLQGYDRQPDGRYARLELWAAPYVDDPAALSPRFVRTMELRNSTAYGGGWYVMARHDLDPQRLHIIRTSDGTLREWSPPSGRVSSRGAEYVSDHEILVEAGEGSTRFDPHLLPIVD